MRRCYGTDLSKRALENLIKCGACDCFGLHRSQMLQIYDTVLDSVANSRRKNVDGQMGLFDSFADDAEPVVPAVRVPDFLPRPPGNDGDGKGDDRSLLIRPPDG